MAWDRKFRAADGSVPRRLAVADLDEASGEDVQEESTYELDGVDGGGVAVLGAKAVVLFVEAEEALVREADPVGVSGKVSEHLVWTAERPLGVDHPLLAVQAILEVVEGLGIGQSGAGANKLEGATVVETGEPLKELSTKDLGYRLDREEVAAARATPMPVVIEATRCNDAMGVRKQRSRVHVCRTAVTPSCARRRRRPKSSSVRAADSSTKSSISLGFSRARARSSQGSVKTT
jgi:hypothetical protein